MQPDLFCIGGIGGFELVFSSTSNIYNETGLHSFNVVVFNVIDVLECCSWNFIHLRSEHLQP
jgi:hypothetical protein